jgi:P-type Mg2+ transporter
MALGVVTIAVALPLLPIGYWFGFVSPPLFFAYLTSATLAYLALVEIVKASFYRAMAGRSPQSRHGQV